MHPQGDSLYGYGPTTTHFLAYFRLVLGATNTPPAPRFRPVLGLAAPAAPFGSFGTFRDLGSPEPQNMHVHVLGFLADRPPRQPTFRPRAPLGGHAPVAQMCTKTGFCAIGTAASSGAGLAVAVLAAPAPHSGNQPATGCSFVGRPLPRCVAFLGPAAAAARAPWRAHRPTKYMNVAWCVSGAWALLGRPAARAVGLRRIPALRELRAARE